MYINRYIGTYTYAEMFVIMYTHVQVGVYIGLCMQVHLCINTFVHIPCIRITPLTGVETKCGFRLAGQQWKPDRAKTCIDIYICMYTYFLHILVPLI